MEGFPLSEEILLEVKGIEKKFPGVKALDKVNFVLKKGEIHAVMGENGAGKSTLMNIIDGVYTPDAGKMYINGKQVQIKSTLDAQKYGIGFIHQEIALCPDVTVAENIFMSEIITSKKPVVNFNELYKRAAQILENLENIDPRKNVSELSVSSQQVVEIAKAISRDCKVLILDEPTSALTENETEALFKIMRSLKKRGIGIIYISHRMAEVFNECDRVTILRDGCYIDTFNIKDVNSKTLVDKMVGREISTMYPEKKKPGKSKDKAIFEVKNISDGKRFYDINFKLQEGEILGLAGLVGAGRSEVAQGICGFTPLISGEVYYHGKKVKINSAKDSIKNGIVYLTEDRKSLGLFLDMAIKYNISVMNINKLSQYGIINNNMENDLCRNYMSKLSIKSASMEHYVSSLSGGNQQKVLISKLLTVNPKIVFMDEPTRGIDVGAKSEIHKLIRYLVNEGMGIILISSELPEIIGMCDRVLVMHEGRISGEVVSAEINEKKIINLASGIND